MNLKTRIEYFNSMKLDGWWVNIDYCYQDMKELLLTDDGKKLFIYWIDADGDSRKIYIVLSIWDLKTKLRVDGWCTSERSFNSNVDWEKNLKNLMKVYPECYLDSWNFKALS